MAYLASFGGITRIRFKGFDRRLCADHLSQAAPPHLFLDQNKTHLNEVNKLEIVALRARRRLRWFTNTSCRVCGPATESPPLNLSGYNNS
jgi:hypothetical protein